MPDKLELLAAARRSQKASVKRIRAEAETWAREKIADQRHRVERIVVELLEDDVSITKIADAYTVSDRSPNRAAIYRIKQEHNVTSKTPVIYPFRWVEREVVTLSGYGWVWDAVADLDEYGPDKITGRFEWKYYSGFLEPVITERDPYPTSRYYSEKLSEWLSANPYPEEQE